MVKTKQKCYNQKKVFAFYLLAGLAVLIPVLAIIFSLAISQNKNIYHQSSAPKYGGKPTAFHLNSSVSGDIPPNQYVSVTLSVSPSFPCSSISSSLRSSGELVLRGSLTMASGNCENYIHDVEIFLPPDSEGTLIVDVSYTSLNSLTYAGSKAIRFATKQTSSVAPGNVLETEDGERIYEIQSE